METYTFVLYCILCLDKDTLLMLRFDFDIQQHNALDVLQDSFESEKNIKMCLEYPLM